MKLIQARVRGSTTLAESRWFDLSPHLNLFQFPSRQYCSNFLRILETINPAYPCETVKPFADLPKIVVQGGHTRRLHPAKRTVAMAVFNAPPRLVKELAPLNPLLYETDRIEVGRRLDYSRWINFVELASSTRWSEIAAEVQTLLAQSERLSPDRPLPVADIVLNLQPADRIKDGLQERLAQWLENLPAEMWKGSAQLIESTILAVRRADHFETARRIVGSRLPLVAVIDGDVPPAQPPDRGMLSDPASPAFLRDIMLAIADRIDSADQDLLNGQRAFLDELNEQLASPPFGETALRLVRSPGGVSLVVNGRPVHQLTDGPLSTLRRIQAKAWLAIAYSRVTCRTEPILLFDGPERALPDVLHRELADFIFNISSTCQCLYGFGEIDIFHNNSVAGRRYSAAEISMPQDQKNRQPAMPVDGHP